MAYGLPDAGTSILSGITPSYVSPIQNNTYGGILPTYVSPIRPTITPVVNAQQTAVSIQPRINLFDTITSGISSIAGAVRTGASAVGDATRTYAGLKTTVQTQGVQSASDIQGATPLQGTAAPVPNSGNTLTIPYLLPDGTGNNINTYVLIAAAILLAVFITSRAR